MKALAIATSLVLVISGVRLAGQQNNRMDYHDASELGTALATAAISRHAQLFTIGHSIDYRTDPARPAIYPIHAIRISGSTSESPTDDNRKNAILFECGSHAREWLATESCWSLVQHLVNHAEDDASAVPELLANVDVWVVALTNTSGRVIDDPERGNPNVYANGAGWRGNGDTRGGCASGVNIARNFSTGWSDAASTDCTDDDGQNDPVSNYRGFAPFSTLEATTLRDFVQNHTISMAVVVHSNATKIWNLWGNGDTAGATIRGLAALAWAARLDDARITLTESGVGGGIGQFSAWLAGSSDKAGEPDEGTARNIQTIFVELPFLDADLDNDVDHYNTSIYRDTDPDDTSNGFHPSSSNVRDMIRGSFLFMAEELIREARSPGCSTLGGCRSRDFGLVGAKIGKSSLSAGLLDSYSSGCTRRLENGICTSGLVAARDYLNAGSYYLDFRVQNFSTDRDNDDLRATVTVTGTNSRGNALPVVSTNVDFNDLDLREARTGRVTLDLSSVGADYTVAVTIAPRGISRDDFSNNDSKKFKFRTR